jgi:hypothetical protein
MRHAGLDGICLLTVSARVSATKTWVISVVFVMCTTRPVYLRLQKDCGKRNEPTLGHVWTAPGWQELSSRVQQHVMQSRSIRQSRQPTWASAWLNAWY